MFKNGYILTCSKILWLYTHGYIVIPRVCLHQKHIAAYVNLFQQFFYTFSG